MTFSKKLQWKLDTVFGGKDHMACI